MSNRRLLLLIIPLLMTISGHTQQIDSREASVRARRPMKDGCRKRSRK